MAKRTQKRGGKARKAPARTASRKSASRRSVKRQKKSGKPRAAATRARKAPRKATKARKAAAPTKSPRLDRARRTLDDVTIPTPPSSLDMDRRSSAARSGRAEMLGERAKKHGMTAITAGDVDVNAEDAFFTGDEAPGGDNPTPDQDIVDDIGRAVGVQYQDDEELQGGDEVARRDKHRWEMDPASSDDYRDRKK